MYSIKSIRSLTKTRLLTRLPEQSQRLVSSTKKSQVQQTQLRRPVDTDNTILWGRQQQGQESALSSSSTTGGSWSSPHDSIARNSFTKDHARLWTLLEAAIAQGDLKRGESLLTGLSGMASKNDMTLAVNNFLLKLVEMNPENPQVAREWLGQISQKIRSFEANSITDATLLKNLCTAGQTDEIKAFINDYIGPGNNRSGLKRLLMHVDVLGLKALQSIIEECNLPLEIINEKYREVILQASSLSNKNDPNNSDSSIDLEQVEKEKQIFAMEKGYIPSLQKGDVDEVSATNTFGMKAIRHTLRGLKNSDQIMDIMAPHLQDKNFNNKNYVDFLELYENLPEAQKLDFERELNKLNHKRQQELEARGYEGAREKWRNDFEKQRTSSNKKNDPTQIRKLDTLLWEWNEAMLPLVKQEFEKISQVLQYSKPGSVPSHLKTNDGPVKNISTSDRFEYGPYLLLVKPENLAAITMIELLNLNSTGGVNEGMRSSRAVVEVGRTVEQEFRRTEAHRREREAMKGFKMSEEKNPELIHQTLSDLKSEISTSDLHTKHASWPTTVRAKIGSLLIAMLLQVAKISVVGRDPVTGSQVHGKAPAFYHSYQYQNGNKLGVLKVHKNLARHLNGEVMASAVQPQRLPMLVKPRPWTAYNKGGYLYSSTKVMRSRDSPEQIAYLKAASDMGQLDEVYKGLNVLGETAWTVNKGIFEVVLKVWNTGNEFLDIPQRVDVRVELPPAPPRDCDPSERRDWMRECRLLVNKNQQLFSQRCDANYKLEIARAYLGERFYFPHNIDFRGRAYPLSPLLNHLGNDLSRGLLKFWEGHELGESGLRWLKIHIANVFGYSKMSFDDRCQFVEDNISKVLDSANNPLEEGPEHGWWKEAESPWQCLAACIELRDALLLDDPTKFVSRIPVHQDGTCNGLQHYAALGGDFEGAEEVNLVPGSKPQDVYTRVLEIVEKMVQEDSVKGVEVAKLFDGKLSRKIVKQTVMTNVYGVTFVGARQQIANKLKDFADLDRLQVFQMSTYLAKQVLLAVRKLFYGAHLIQDWLGDNATLIARSVRLDVNTEEYTHDRRYKSAASKRPNYMSSVIWTSPLGLPCVQPYREDKKKQVITAIQSVFIADPYAMRGVNARKQRTAFPPNYIHSLDATHMLMSAVGCGEAGLTFASVHDSYWTHAGTVDQMNSILRDKFIELHSDDLVGKLKEEFEERYQGLLHLVEIPKESEVAQRILKLRGKYAQEMGYGDNPSKLTIQQQLNIERERMQLLHSKDPERQARGETMVTPVAVVESIEHEELEQLVRQAGNMTEIKKEKSKKDRVRKSSEFEGSGVDMYSAEYGETSREELEGEVELLAPDEEEILGHGNAPSSVMAVGADSASSSSETSSSSSSRAGGTGSKKRASVVSILVPLRIPTVPPKGEFDVKMLRDSKYFFS